MRHLIVIVLGLGLLFAAGTGVKAEERPSQVIQTLYDTLLTVMKEADSLGYEGRHDRLEPLIPRTYNMRMIAFASVSKPWKGWDKAQRKRLVDALTRLTVATYAARFDGYSGEQLNVLSEEPAAPNNTVLVKTELVKGDGEVIRLDYLMYKSKRGWRVVDVYLNGVISEVGIRRSEYGAVIARGGLDGLIKALEKQIEKYRASATQ